MGNNNARATDDEPGSSSSDGESEATSEYEGSDRPGLVTTAWSHLFACAASAPGFDFIPSARIKCTLAPSQRLRRKAFIPEGANRNIDDFFDVEREKALGEGGNATVCRGTNKATKALRAVKCVLKGYVADRRRLRKELEIMMALDHPNIAKLYQIFEDPRFIYIVLELCSGGDVFDRIVEQGHLSEPDAAVIMEQLFRAVNYLHQMSICHRDLKPENIMFQSAQPIESNVLKVIDFGIAERCEPGQRMRTKTGTPYYVAPEVIQGRYGRECDLWSLGVIMYVLLSGMLPFKGDDDKETFAKILEGRYKFDRQRFGEVSRSAKELIRQLLQVKPGSRITLEAALRADWITRGLRGGAAAPGAQPQRLQPAVVENLRGFQTESRLKKEALHLIARQLDESEIAKLRKTFVQLDANREGTLTYAELKNGVHTCQLAHSLKDLDGLIDAIDTDGNGTIDYTEFLAATLERRHYEQESVCWAAFKVFDHDNDGRISPSELQAVLKSKGIADNIDQKNVETIMREHDLDNNGYIDFSEFLAMMRK